MEQEVISQDGVQGWQELPSSSSPRDCLHHSQEACDFIKSSVTTTHRLEIKKSVVVGSGSGLFFGGEKPLQDGCEIFRSKPMLSCANSDSKTLCHWCYLDSSSAIHPSGAHWVESHGPLPVVSACTGCYVARFCSPDCQRKAWKRFHRDECGILKEHGTLSPRILAIYRLIFWQGRKLITNSQAQVIKLLETHFRDYIDDDNKERASSILDSGDAIHRSTKTKLSMGAVWQLFGVVKSNSTMMRGAFHNHQHGAALDLAMATINHSCEPNAWVFFENGETRLHSLSIIQPGDEITICYLDPTIFVALRKSLVGYDHFFVCDCRRCRRESNEEKELMDHDATKLANLHRVQNAMYKLTNDAALARTSPGSNRELENPDEVQRRLLQLALKAFPSKVWWPDSLSPMPTVRMALADLYIVSHRLSVALRNALKGNLCSEMRNTPSTVNNLETLAVVLILLGDQPAEAPDFENPALPQRDEMRVLAWGYILLLNKMANRVFGDCAYAKAMEGWCVRVASQLIEPRPGSVEFREKFEAAQVKLLKWAGIETKLGITLPC